MIWFPQTWAQVTFLLFMQPTLLISSSSSNSSTIYMVGHPYYKNEINMRGHDVLANSHCKIVSLFLPKVTHTLALWNPMWWGHSYISKFFICLYAPPPPPPNSFLFVCYCGPAHACPMTFIWSCIYFIAPCDAFWCLHINLHEKAWEGFVTSISPWLIGWWQMGHMLVDGSALGDFSSW